MRLGLDRLWLFLAMALPALASLIAPLPAVDLAYQVRAGDQILATGAIPATDTYTFTVAGAPWTDQQWLAQVLLALGFRLGGWEALAVLRALLVVVAFGLLAAVAMARGTSPRTAAILSLLAFVLAAPALALRPQLFGIVLFAGLLLLAALRHRHPRWYLVAPVLVVAWANVHGSFVLAPLLLGWAWLDDVVRRRPARPSFMVLLAGIAATLVSPLGFGGWTYAAGIGNNPLIATQAAEWQRTTPFEIPGLLFYVSAIGIGGLVVARRRRLAWPDWLWIAGLFVIGAWAQRGLAWWPLGVIPVVASALAERGAVTSGSAGTHRTLPANRLNALVAAVLGLAIVLALPWWRPSDPLTGRRGLLTYAPSGLALALREHVAAGDRVFVPQSWASWFEWAVPDARYFVDSRFELFPAETWREYDAVANGPSGASATLDRWGVVALVIAKSPGGNVVSPGIGWVLAHEDMEGVLFLRVAP